jgi:hypothetical protein
MAQNKESWKKAYLKNQLELAINQLQLWKEQLDYIEGNQLLDATQILFLSEKQLRAGEINYLDWATLQKQTLEIRLNYLAAIELYNFHSIQVSYLNAQ